MKFWSFPGGPHEPTLYEIQRNGPLPAKGWSLWEDVNEQRKRDNERGTTTQSNVSHEWQSWPKNIDDFGTPPEV